MNEGSHRSDLLLQLILAFFFKVSRPIMVSRWEGGFWRSINARTGFCFAAGIVSTMEVHFNGESSLREAGTKDLFG